MLKKSERGRQLFFSILFCSTCFGISNAYRGYVMEDGANYIQNFFFVFLIGLLFALEIYFCTVFKESKKSLPINILYNVVYTLSLASVAYIYSKLIYTAGDNQDFIPAAQYWLITGIVLILVTLTTYIVDLWKREKQ